MLDERIRVLKEDLRNAHEVIVRTGLLIGGNEASDIEKMLWLLARGLYDILEDILRSKGEW